MPEKAAFLPARSWGCFAAWGEPVEPFPTRTCGMGGGVRPQQEGAPRVTAPWRPTRAGRPHGTGLTVLSGGIAQRRRDLGREPPRLPRGTKGKESSDMAVRLPTFYFWSGSADGSFILLKIKLLLCQMSSLRASKREPEARIRRRG